MVKRIKFSCGVELIFKEFKDRNSSSVGIWIREGSREEPLEHKGIAHYLEHLLFKGTKKYSYKSLKQEIEGRGGQLNGFTSQEITCFYANTLYENAEIALDVLSDMVVEPLLRKEDVNRERGVILEEAKMYRDIPSARVSSLLDSLLWQGHPLGIDVIGNEESINSISRDNLAAFKKAYYRPSNIVIVICARQIPKNLDKNVISKLKRNPGKKASLRFPGAKVPAGFHLRQELTSFAQSHLSLGFEGFNSFDERKFALEIINIIMGANMSSRLFEEIREQRGLAYEVSTSTKRFKDTGAFIVHCGLEAKNLALAFKVIIKELNRLKETLIGKKEFLRAKDFLLGNLSMKLESTSNSMEIIGDYFCHLNKVPEYKDIEREILKITPGAVRKIAKEVFCYDKMKVAIVTDTKESYSGSFRKILGSLG